VILKYRREQKGVIYFAFDWHYLSAICMITNNKKTLTLLRQVDETAGILEANSAQVNRKDHDVHCNGSNRTA
jgi:hypothetical protein